VRPPASRATTGGPVPPRQGRRPELDRVGRPHRPRCRHQRTPRRPRGLAPGAGCEVGRRGVPLGRQQRAHREVGVCFQCVKQLRSGTPSARPCQHPGLGCEGAWLTAGDVDGARWSGSSSRVHERGDRAR
jgi:hypothetical protein